MTNLKYIPEGTLCYVTLFSAEGHGRAVSTQYTKTTHDISFDELTFENYVPGGDFSRIYENLLPAKLDMYRCYSHNSKRAKNEYWFIFVPIEYADGFKT